MKRLSDFLSTYQRELVDFAEDFDPDSFNSVSTLDCIGKH